MHEALALRETKWKPIKHRCWKTFIRVQFLFHNFYLRHLFTFLPFGRLAASSGFCACVCVCTSGIISGVRMSFHKYLRFPPHGAHDGHDPRLKYLKCVTRAPRKQPDMDGDACPDPCQARWDKERGRREEGRRGGGGITLLPAWVQSSGCVLLEPCPSSHSSSSVSFAFCGGVKPALMENHLWFWHWAAFSGCLVCVNVRVFLLQPPLLLERLPCIFFCCLAALVSSVMLRDRQRLPERLLYTSLFAWLKASIIYKSYFWFLISIIARVPTKSLSQFSKDGCLHKNILRWMDGRIDG